MNNTAYSGHDVAIKSNG